MQNGETIQIGSDNWLVHTKQPDRVVLVRPSPLREWREKRGLSVRVAAQKLGLSPTQVTRIERGHRPCPPHLLAWIAVR